MDHGFFIPPRGMGGEVAHKIIHCNVWGDIQVDALAMAIVDTWAFQRLHYIHQTGILYKIFPTATTTRFEHAMGSYCVAKKFLHKLWVTSPSLFSPHTPFFLLPIAAMCRQLGCGPFSGLFDRFLQDHSVQNMDWMWLSPEGRSCAVLDVILDHVSFPYRVSPDHRLFIKSLLLPLREEYQHPLVQPWFQFLVHDESGGLDFPTMDSVLRDARALGLIPSFDLQRILENTRIIDQKLCFCTRVEDDLEMFTATRLRLQKTAYHHPRVRRFEDGVTAMLNETLVENPRFRTGFLRILKDNKDNRDNRDNHKETQVREFLEWTDTSFLGLWQASPAWRSLETRIQVDHEKEYTHPSSPVKAPQRPRYWFHRKRPQEII